MLGAYILNDDLMMRRLWTQSTPVRTKKAVYSLGLRRIQKKAAFQYRSVVPSLLELVLRAEQTTTTLPRVAYGLRTTCQTWEIFILKTQHSLYDTLNNIQWKFPDTCSSKFLNDTTRHIRYF